MMDREQAERNWRADAELLAEVGRHLFTQRLRVNVRLPRHLADRAQSSWARADYEDSIDGETPEQKTIRHRAGTLGLIGLSVEQHSHAVGGEVLVDLDAWFIGSALDAAEEAGLLNDLRAPSPDQPE